MSIRSFVLGIALLSFTLIVNGQDVVKHVSATDFKAMIEAGKGQLVDIRTPGEFQAGHINGAVMIDYYSSEYKSQLQTLDKNKPVLLYCRSGNRSGRSVSLLQQMGFKEIVNLQRGIIDWNNSGFQLTN